MKELIDQYNKYRNDYENLKLKDYYSENEIRNFSKKFLNRTYKSLQSIVINFSDLRMKFLVCKTKVLETEVDKDRCQTYIVYCDEIVQKLLIKYINPFRFQLESIDTFRAEIRDYIILSISIVISGIFFLVGIWMGKNDDKNTEAQLIIARDSISYQKKEIVRLNDSLSRENSMIADSIETLKNKVILPTKNSGIYMNNPTPQDIDLESKRINSNNDSLNVVLNTK